MIEPIDPNAYASYDPSPYGYEDLTPPPTGPGPASSNQRWTVLFVVGSLVVAVVVAAVLTSWMIRDDHAPRVALPDTFEGYTLLHSAASERIDTALRSVAASVGGPTKSIFDSGTIGVYGTSEVPSLIVFALRTDAVSGAGSAAEGRVSALLAQFLPNPGVFPAGPHGGSEKCGLTEFGGVPESACAWSDATTTGMIVSVNPPLGPPQAASVTLALRDLIDK